MNKKPIISCYFVFLVKLCRREIWVLFMLKTSIIGASGYTGAELASMVQNHPNLTLAGLYVSANSVDAGKSIASIHARLSGVVDAALLPLTDIDAVAKHNDVIFLATAHEVSHDLAPLFLAKGCQVFDLSGAFRVSSPNFYREYYGFIHQHDEWTCKSAYGLAEWNQQSIQESQMIAVPGCYPTASQLAIRPVIDLLDSKQWPIINAISGVSGAGRKSTLVNSFCEVSLQPYGLFTHRHQPEISHHLGNEVVFIPHLGNFKRGIIATITMKLSQQEMEESVAEAFYSAYKDKPAIRLLESQMPSIQGVENTPFCDIAWRVQGQHLIVVSAIDNLLKGAASQAMQCLNIHYGFPELTALLPQVRL